MNRDDIFWNGAPHEPHVFPALSLREHRRDRIKAWLAHQPIVHRLLDLAVVGALPGLGAYARFVAPHTLEITEHIVPVKGLSSNLEGLRVAHLTDLHIGKSVPREFLEHCIDTTNRCHPDLVALTGDFLQWDPGYIEVLAHLVRRLDAPLGVYAVLGNHDYGLNSPGGARMLDHATGDLVAGLERAGVTVLRNGWDRLEVGGDALHVIGVDDLWSGECDPAGAFAGLPDQGPRLFLCHNPDGFGYHDRYRFDVMLSGHTHGAQVRIPGAANRLKALVPLRDPRFLAGFYGRPGAWVYVNRGLGYIWKFRLNSAPEIACHTLRRARGAGDRPVSYRRHRERWRPSGPVRAEA